MPPRRFARTCGSVAAEALWVGSLIFPFAVEDLVGVGRSQAAARLSRAWARANSCWPG
jgi:hypothetical protein